MKQPRHETIQPSGPKNKKMRLSELTAKEIFANYLQRFASSAVASNQQTDKFDRQPEYSPSQRLEERKELQKNFQEAIKRNIIENTKRLNLAYSARNSDHLGTEHVRIEAERMDSIFLNFVASVCEDFLEDDAECPLPVLVLQNEVLVKLFQSNSQDNLWIDQLFDFKKDIDQGEEIGVASFASLLFRTIAENKKTKTTKEASIYICIGYIITLFIMKISVARLNGLESSNEMTTLDWNTINQDLQKYLKKSWISNHASNLEDYVNLGIVFFVLDCMEKSNQFIEIENLEDPSEKIRECLLLDMNVELKGLYVTQVTETLRQDNW